MPESTIHLGAKMNPNDIEEGDDVYFGCKVDANPPAYKVVWEHNVSNKSLNYISVLEFSTFYYTYVKICFFHVHFPSYSSIYRVRHKKSHYMY